MISRHEIIKQNARIQRQRQNKLMFSKVNVGMMLLSSAFVLQQATEKDHATENIGQLRVVEAKNSPQQFLGLVADYAKNIAAKNDLYASVMIAQAALESGWGNSSLATNYNNLFGIKGSYNGNSATLDTLEDDGSGNYYSIKDGFRAYDNVGQSLQDYADLLTGSNDPNNWRYNFYSGSRVSNTNTYTDATTWLTGRYATDTRYGEKLNRLIQDYNLTQYDSYTGGNSSANASIETAVLSAAPAPVSSGTGTYTVQPGESVWGISRKFGMSMDDLRAINNIQGNFIYPGQVLSVNGSGARSNTNTSSISPSNYQSNNEIKTVSTGGTYTVQAGESVWGISRKFGMSMDSLIALNNIQGNFIYAGQVLKVAGQPSVSNSENTSITLSNTLDNTGSDFSQSTVKTTIANGTYTVQAGESVWGISRKFGMSMDTLVELNNIQGNYIYAGQVLRVDNSNTSLNLETPSSEISVYSEVNNAESQVSDTVEVTSEVISGSTYIIQRGDSLYGIARQHGISLATLIQLNGFSGPDQLVHPGQSIIVG